ncbi:hypothetical protein C8R46DRAFT_1349411 [Mycena filopes]|nr:hypothetical protein C8R46DRAFT_1349411 [Mycena filopes]
MALSHPPLPLDLLRPILSHVTDKESLLQLCHVSRRFHHEAQRLLYTDVALHSEAVSPFCWTLAICPTLSSHVRRLSLQLADSFTYLPLVARCLRSLHNLQALEITGDYPPAQPWRTTAATLPPAPWAHRGAAHILLAACPFRLKLFISAFRMADASMIAFLETQPEIEELVSLSTAEGGVVVLGAEALPRLREYAGAVTRLEFRTEEGRERRVFRARRLDVEVVLNVGGPRVRIATN